MPLNQIPYPVPSNIRDLLMVRLSERGIDKLTSEQRAHVRNLVAEVYAGGYADGRIAEHSFASLDRQLSTRPEPAPEPEVTHRWQTVRVTGAGQYHDGSDFDARGFEAEIVLRCTCGTRATVRVEPTGLTFPPCPDSPEVRS